VVPFLKYSVLRLALFVGVLALLVVLRAGPLIAIAGAALVSMMLSYLFLRRPREELTAAIAGRMDRRALRRPPSGHTEDERHEDAVADAAERGGPGQS
jgi:hypothetical protein